MEYTYVKYEYWKSVNYSCKAIAPNTTKDVAVHWHPPFHLRKGAKIAIIVLASVIGLLAAAFFVRWMGKWDERRMARIRAQREREDGERLPGYRFVNFLAISARYIPNPPIHSSIHLSIHPTNQDPKTNPPTSQTGA